MAAQDGARPNTGEPGDEFCSTVVAQNGRLFTEAVLHGASRESVLSSEAASMLGVKVKTLANLARYTYGDAMGLD